MEFPEGADTKPQGTTEPLGFLCFKIQLLGLFGALVFFEKPRDNNEPVRKEGIP